MLYNPLLHEDYIADLEPEHSIPPQETAEIDAQIERLDGRAGVGARRAGGPMIEVRSPHAGWTGWRSPGTGTTHRAIRAW